MRIALIGTRGVPARYGGFETCVEEVGRRLAANGHEVIVYCRSSADEADERPTSYAGMQLVHLPAMRKKSLETLSHTALSMLHLLWITVRGRGVDAAVVFNSANAPFLPLVRMVRTPVVTHVDGLEWKRSKWQGAGKTYYRFAESLAVRWSDALIADAQGIADYYLDQFGAATELIAYGAPITTDERSDKVVASGLTPRGYHLVVARFEPENHVAVIVEGYRSSAAQLPLVVVGSAPYADEYTAQIRAAADERVQFRGAVWDQDELDQLYANALTYLHGHSVGGTNPSLLRALGAAAPTIAYDVVFNREVLADSGRFFADAEQLRSELELAEDDRAVTLARGAQGRESARRYDWDEVAKQYEDLCTRVAAARRARARLASGRRSNGGVLAGARALLRDVADRGRRRR